MILLILRIYLTLFPNETYTYVWCFDLGKKKKMFLSVKKEHLFTKRFTVGIG